MNLSYTLATFKLYITNYHYDKLSGQAQTEINQQEHAVEVV